MTHTQNYLSKVNQNEFFNMSKFVVTENFKHHTDEELPNSYNSDITSVYNEEMDYSRNSHFYAVKNEIGEIIGTIRALKWDYINPLPIQKMFGINPLLCLSGNSVNEIWHIGRFAIKKGARDISLLKKLMVSAIAPICKHEDNIAFAECDAKLLRIMTLMGIKTKIVGKSIDYLGSETIPVSIAYNGLINFYNENKYLMQPAITVQTQNTTLLPNSVVFNA